MLAFVFLINPERQLAKNGPPVFNEVDEGMGPELFCFRTILAA